MKNINERIEESALPRVVQIPLGYVNAFLIRGKQTIIVDTGYGGHEKKIIEKLNALDIRPKSVSLIIITHGHRDHFGGVEEVQRFTGAPVAIHRNDYLALTKGNMSLTPRTFLGRILHIFAKETSAIPGFIESDSLILIDDKFTLNEYGVDGFVLNTPGHTQGSLSVHLASGEAIIGDMCMGILRKKKAGFPLVADDIGQLYHSLKLVLAHSPTVIYAGHGGPFSPDSVRALLSNTAFAKVRDTE
jgi:hydroxyacylglutathione hydrolase